MYKTVHKSQGIKMYYRWFKIYLYKNKEVLKTAQYKTSMKKDY